MLSGNSLLVGIGAIAGLLPALGPPATTSTSVRPSPIRALTEPDAPASAGTSTRRSYRVPGGKGRDARSGSNVSVGWPSTAITKGLSPSNRRRMIRALHALARRSRTRPPVGTSTRRGRGLPLTVSQLPRRPDGPQPPPGPGSKGASAPSSVSRQSSTRMGTSRSTEGGVTSSTTRRPVRPRSASSPLPPPSTQGRIRNVPASGGVNRYSNPAPGASGSWVRPPTPSMAFGPRIP